MERSFWETRYAEAGFAYGTEPNAFLVSRQARFQPGQTVLLIGEGEGRNGVWLARQGLQVTAVDQSETGLAKAREMAREAGVSLQTICADLTQWQWPVDEYDFVVSIFVHFKPGDRRSIHRACLAALKPGGTILLEGFTPEQIDYPSGGPPFPEMLFSEAMLREDFAGAKIELLESLETRLAEGKYHQGSAAVLRLIATRP
ncbi:MAG: class I SAM-dependent methyltransferase [Thiohalophilus sp.]|uniref:SAM-dependent methyltransferase n=1 Tax=Thiohalophilus sp. TaxID=3028392 RepID=UPI0028700C0B|nr:class I SAM-dependent methyltransferase [Thiohalophilus sp.]MDR9435887.1 class I SAM-dependent methyltransferase [Thiohalophilus sp.]